MPQKQSYWTWLMFIVFTTTLILGCYCKYTVSPNIVNVLQQDKLTLNNNYAQLSYEKREQWRLSCVYICITPTSPTTIQQLTSFAGLKSLTLVGSSTNLMTDKVRNLKHLSNLRHIGVESSLLNKIGVMPKIKSLEVKGTETTWLERQDSLLQLVNFPDLRQLKLDGFCINSFGYRELNEVKELKLLNSTIDETAWCDLTKMKHLRMLKLENIFLTKTNLKYLEKMRHLENLTIGWDVGYTNRAVMLATDLSKLTTLKELTTVDCDSEGECSNVIWDLSNAPDVRVPKSLQELSFAIDPERFASLPEWLNQIDILNINIVSRKGEMRSFKEGTNLNALNTHSNLNVSLCYSGYEDVDSFVQLVVEISTILTLKTPFDNCPSCNPLTDKGVRFIGTMSQLESLEIRGFYCSDLSGLGVNPLRNLNRLRILKFAEIPTDKADKFAFLSELKHLQELSFGCVIGKEDNDVHNRTIPGNIDDVLNQIQGLIELDKLTIQNATLTDKGLNKLRGLKRLRRLDLTGTYGYTDKGLGNLMQDLPNLDTVLLTYDPQRQGVELK